MSATTATSCGLSKCPFSRELIDSVGVAHPLAHGLSLVRAGVRTTAGLTTTYVDTNPLLTRTLDLTIVVPGSWLAFIGCLNTSIPCPIGDVLRERRRCIRPGSRKPTDKESGGLVGPPLARFRRRPAHLRVGW